MEVNTQPSENTKRDLALAERAAKGEQAAFNELMKLYKRRIFSVVLKLINNRDDAEDLTMEIFGKAFTNIQSYNPQYAFSTWIGRIATNHTIDHIRKKRLQTTSMEHTVNAADGGDLKVESAVKDNALIADDDMMKQQRHATLRSCIEKLSDNYKTLVKLYYFEEMSYDEIANELDLPLGTVKAQLFRARNYLFEMMKGGIHSGNL